MKKRQQRRSHPLWSYLCLATLTIVLVMSGVPARAVDLINAPLRSATTTHSTEMPLISQVSLLDQGRTHYEAGQFAEAATLWQQAAATYRSQGDAVNQALTLSYLSLAYQELGQWQAAETTIYQSLKLLKQPNTPPAILAHGLNTQGSLQLAMGQPEVAIETWQQAAAAYEKAGDLQGMWGAEINQAEALQAMGLYRRAQTLLMQIQSNLQTQPDSLLKATGLRSLGMLMQATGEFQLAQTVLEQSLAITQAIGQPAEMSATLFSLGNAYQAAGAQDKALNAYQQAATLAPDQMGQVEAELNQLNVLIQMQQWQAVQPLLAELQTQIPQLSASRSAIYAQVNLAERWMELYQQSEEHTKSQLPTVRRMAELLATAIQQSQSIQDPRAESSATGQLGKLYELTQQWPDAQRLTQQALALAQANYAEDMVYRWQWQLGRILKQQGDTKGAIAAYTGSVETLKILRSDLVAMNTDVQFSFRKQIEPIYRELVSLLLANPQPGQDNLQRARNVIESLQLAELENFFRSACLDTKSQQIDQIDRQAAVIYPIILPEQLSVIVSIPGEPLAYHATQLPESQIEDVLEQLLQSLNPAFSNRERLRLSEQLYDWLIRPAETLLASHNLKTLVFVPDGTLKNLPMSVLYDGQQYLIENYSVALTPGLQLVAAQTLHQKQVEVLMGGLSESRQGFAALPGVEQEIEQISSHVPIGSLLLNQNFTKASFEQDMSARPAPVVHLATHGQFSSNPQETFILTWDDRVSIQDLYSLLQTRTLNEQNPLELLILSACETAVGDDRAALGLAGLAVRSGARSTVASLWSVNDESTAQLMTEFYQQLVQNASSRAEALRQGQLSLLKSEAFSHPYYWAAFVLVGNWL